MEWLFPRRRFDVLMLGLEDSGKTTILHRLLTGENKSFPPTFGFNMELVPFGDIELDIMDIGGCEKMLPLWKHYLTNASAIIYVVNCCDLTKIYKNKVMIADILSRPERKRLPLLVIINKLDSASHSLSADSIEMMLDLKSFCHCRRYKVFRASARTGEHIQEAFTWLCAALGSSDASKSIKRMQQKRTKREARDKNVKRRKRDFSRRSSSAIYKAYDVKSNNNKGIKLELKQDSTTNNQQTESRPFTFPESFQKLNKFFKFEASHKKDNKNLTSPIGIETSSKRQDVFAFDVAHSVDTLSSEPYSPLSPRRKISMNRKEEIMKVRNSILGNTDISENNDCSYISDVKLAEESESNQTSFKDSFIFKKKKFPPERFQNSEIFSNKALDDGIDTIPRSSRVISRRWSKQTQTIGLYPKHNMTSVSSQIGQENTRRLSENNNDEQLQQNVDSTKISSNGTQSHSRFLSILASVRLSSVRKLKN